MIIENGIKHIRMGWKNGFIAGVILSDGTILQNMQCDLSMPIPNDEELEKVNRQNMKVGVN